MTTRREFLQQMGVSSSAGLALGAPATGWFAPLAHAVDQQQPNTQGKILVVIQLSGGNDGLNTVVPFGDDHYYKSRPSLGIAKNALIKLEDGLGLHPRLGPLKKLYDLGMVSIVQGVGYPNPDRSHFRSMDIWHAAKPDANRFTDGWLGRALEEKDSWTQNGKVAALGIGSDQLPLALTSREVAVPTIRNLASYQRQFGGNNQPESQPRKNIINQLAQAPQTSGNETLDFLRRTTRTAYVSSDKIKKQTQSYRAQANYRGDGLSQQLKMVAQLIASDLGTRIYYVSLGGFDTHSEQSNVHANLLDQWANAVQAFHTDLKAQGLDDRVMSVTFSEFGRRVKENGSLGTDHGTAAPMFAIGSKVKGGLFGKYPSLANLDREGDLKFTTDFRSVYASVLDRWLGLSSKKILGQAFSPIDFLG